MIETISHLLKEANAQHMQLIIRAKEDGTVSVIANTVLSPYSDKQDSKTLKLRSALSTPLVANGQVGEIDVSFQEALSQYAMSFTEGATILNNASQAAAKIDKAAKQTSAKTKNSKSTQQAATAEAIEKKDVADTPSQPSNKEPNLDDFLSGAAESL
jgi:PRTRC genetic system protein E